MAGWPGTLSPGPESSVQRCPIPWHPEAEELGTTIYEAAEERGLPGADLSNFWRNMDKAMETALRTRVENVSAPESCLPLRSTPVGLAP